MRKYLFLITDPCFFNQKKRKKGKEKAIWVRTFSLFPSTTILCFQRKTPFVKFHIIPIALIWLAAVFLSHSWSFSRLMMENMKAVLTLWICQSWWVGRKGRKISGHLKNNWLLQVVGASLVAVKKQSLWWFFWSGHLSPHHTHIWMRWSS